MVAANCYGGYCTGCSLPSAWCDIPYQEMFLSPQIHLHTPSAGILFWWIAGVSCHQWWCCSLLPAVWLVSLVQLLLSPALPWLPWWFSLVLHLLLALWSWEINILHPHSLVSAQNNVAATVCYFTENFVFLTAMVDTHYDGTNVLDWAVILTNHLHCWTS